jgi:hypothetical protein
MAVRGDASSQPPPGTGMAPARLSLVLGILLPLATLGVGLLIPRSTATQVLIPASFVASGALIGRWWAFLPALTGVLALNLAELIGVHYVGAAIELHGPGSFHVVFLLLTAATATVLALVGVAMRLGIASLLHRGGRLP